MLKTGFFILIFLSFLDGKNIDCFCPEKVTTLFENGYEKIFEFKNRIYKIVKGSDRKDSILMILDETSKRYIVIQSQKSGQENEDEDLELMR